MEMEDIGTYIPFTFESLQIHKLPRNSLVRQNSFILLEQPIANLGVIVFGNCIFEIRFLELIEGDYDAEYFGEGVLEIALCAGFSELDFLKGCS